MTEEAEGMLVARLGHRGDGVNAAGDVFVPGALPGERVVGAVIEGRMIAPRIVAPSPDRVAPPCPHAGECGGCALQHAAPGFLAEWKRERVREALAARGIGGVALRETIVSPPRSRRRATLSARRTKKSVMLGFHARAEDRIVPIETCELADPRIVAALEGLRALVPLVASRKGEAKLAVTVSEAGLDVDLRQVKPLDGPLRARLAEIAAREGWARLSHEGEALFMARPPAQDFDGLPVLPPPGSFLQATPQGEAALRAAVDEALGEARRVVDLFAGCGTFALPLSRRAEVLAVESDAAALAALDAAWRAAGGALRRLTTQARDLFRRPLTPEELRRFDAAVIDPPRAGARAQAQAVAASGLRRVAMVSCDPGSFARDARILIDGGFSLEWVQPVDQFLWSGHVELAAAFARR
ncbi:class I SAM-dependent RNA methyltransferase [Oceanicella actignis]|uniref:class I SAM-dependent RNA methyltransferase n=1 Tax=Oceanicella actignis TaxID=1189325 RepID=UPI00125B0C22|nr:23S rRNA m(5)U-1939 methyltransferase [Oceanicella actignis]